MVKNLDLLLAILLMATVGTLSFVIPKFLANIFNSKEFKLEKSINRRIKEIFLLDSFKVTNDDKAIDEVYERVSKYSGSFRA